MRGFVGLVLALGLNALVLAAAPISDSRIVRVYTTDPAAIRELGHAHDHIQVLREKGFVYVEADAAERDALRERGWRVEIDDIASANFNAPLLAQTRSIPGFTCYRTVAEMKTRMSELVSTYPTLATLVDAGDSWEKVNSGGTGGEDIRVLKLTNTAIAGPKPAFLASFSIHPREYPTAELGLRFAEWLLTNYGTNADATWILDHHEVHVMVMVNPDGRKKAETGLSWRKNTNTAYCGATSNNRGVDLNRNMQFMWNCCGTSSASQCNETYHGPSALSDPEAQALDTYMKLLFPDRRGPALTDAAPTDVQGVYMDIHNFANLVLWPWGFEDPPAPPAPNPAAPNGTAMQTLGRRLAWFNRYKPEQSNELYGADGATDDNAYGQLGVPAFTIELGSTAFFQACGEFESAIYPDNLQALIYAARVVRAPYLLPAGPSVTDVIASPPLAFAGDTVQLSARVDDTRFNQSNGTEATQTISAANAYVGLAPWQAGATAQALVAGDGAFSATAETVTGTLNTTGLSLGKRLVYVQGTDTSGSVGPVSAAFVNIVDPATHGTLQGTVRAVQGGTPLAATVQASSYVAQSSAASGAYLHRLPAGTHALTVSAPGYEPATFTGVNVGAGGTVNQDVNLYSLCPRLSENAENGVGAWTTQGTPAWGIANASGLMTSRFWTESVSGNYGNNASQSLISPTFSMTGYDNAVLNFDTVCDTEAGFDFGIVEVSANGGTNWTEVFRCSGDATLQRRSVSLPQIANAAQARLRLRFTSDSGVTAPGWAVDNIVIEAGGSACRATQGSADALFGNGFE